MYTGFGAYNITDAFNDQAWSIRVPSDDQYCYMKILTVVGIELV